jgi:16S rRNA C967 or C1407 C5-methylase (RsmB/RsmF family)
MEYIYIVVENGEAYPMAYESYKLAVKSIKEKHKEYIQEQIKEIYNLDDIESILADINTPENTETGISKLYIEKGINIQIHKLPIKHY